jgi:glycosyltransferase involved in cell wall biosynthesis
MFFSLKAKTKVVDAFVLDCERMKYKDTGIYYYCLNLGRNIGKQLDPSKESIIYYLPENCEGLFKGRARIQQNSLQKFFMPPLHKYKLWHSTFQHSDYIPFRNRKIKVLLTIHDLNFMHDEQIDEEKKRIYLNRLQKRIDRADAIVNVSEHCFRDVKNYCDTGAKKMEVIHNGKNNLKAPQLYRHSFKPRKPFLFAIGSMRRKKNFHSLIPLIKQNRELELVIAGRPDDNDYLFDLRRTALTEGVSDNVHLIGQISESEKSWYYHHCEAFVCPSEAEGFGLPVVEAMSIGKPVFASSCTALPEIGKEAAFYFMDFSGEKMQECFIKGMGRYHSENMAQDIIKRANEFSWANAAGEYLKIYRQLI